MSSFSVYRTDVPPPRSALSPYEPLQCQEYSLPYWGPKAGEGSLSTLA